MSYRKDRSWSDAYIPALKQVVGPLLLEVAPPELDNQQATDMIVFKARDMRIACRVRRPGYADRYPWDFTIRAKRSNGTQTELSKIINGWGDWLVYAHAADSQQPTLERWLVVNLDAFRAALIADPYTRTQSRNPKPNPDGQTWLSCYDARRIPHVLISSSHTIPSQLVAA